MVDYHGYFRFLSIRRRNPDLGLPFLDVKEFLQVFRAFPAELALLKSRSRHDPANRDLLARVFAPKPMGEANEKSIQCKIPECPVIILREIIIC